MIKLQSWAWGHPPDTWVDPHPHGNPQEEEGGHAPWDAGTCSSWERQENGVSPGRHVGAQPRRHAGSSPVRTTLNSDLPNCQVCCFKPLVSVVVTAAGRNARAPSEMLSGSPTLSSPPHPPAVLCLTR